MVDNERQQQQDFKRKPWLWRGGGEEEEEDRGTKVGFLCTIVACQVPVPNAQTWSVSHCFSGFLPPMVAYFER